LGNGTFISTFFLISYCGLSVVFFFAIQQWAEKGMSEYPPFQLVFFTPLQINYDICSYMLGGIWLAFLAIKVCGYLEKKRLLNITINSMNALTVIFIILVLVVWLITLN